MMKFLKSMWCAVVAFIARSRRSAATATVVVAACCALSLADRASAQLADVILYVDNFEGFAEPSGPNPGDEWDNAFKFLQDALELADEILLEDSVEIWIRGYSVSGGPTWTYRPDQSSGNPGGSNDRAATFFLKNNLGIYGGFEQPGRP